MFREHMVGMDYFIPASLKEKTFKKYGDTPHYSPSLKCELFSVVTAPPLTSGAELETGLKGPLTATI